MGRDVGIVGGTGPLGRGLAARWALAGLEVVLGSRDPERAEQAAAKVREKVGDAAAVRVHAAGNADTADAEVVVLAVPFEALEATTASLREVLADRIVVSAINPLAFDDRGPYALQPEEGSAALACARRLPEARVVAAFHSLSSRQLGRVHEPLGEDVPVFGDDDEALAIVADLTDRIEGVRAVPAGPLRLAGPVEAMTAVIISINKRHGRHVGLSFSHL